MVALWPRSHVVTAHRARAGSACWPRPAKGLAAAWQAGLGPGSPVAVAYSEA
jgi:hypothetical protein